MHCTKVYHQSPISEFHIFLSHSQLPFPPLSARNATLHPNPGNFGGQRLSSAVLSRLTLAMLAALTSHQAPGMNAFCGAAGGLILTTYRTRSVLNLEDTRPGPPSLIVPITGPLIEGSGLSCPFAQDRCALLRCELGLRAQCDVRFMNQTFCHATSFLCPQNNTTCLQR